MTPLPPGADASAAAAWPRFVRQHLHDYPPPALRRWVAIVTIGALVLAGTLVELLLHPSTRLAPVLLGLVLVALAAFFPVQIPRTHHTVLVADAFVFTLLATLGGPVAVLAAGLEAVIGALRSSKRLSSHFSAPCAAMTAMAVCSGSFAALRLGLVMLGMGSEVASLAALCLAAPVYVALTTGPLMAMIASKTGLRLSLRQWFESTSWITAMNLGSAFLAGLVTLNAARFGPAVTLIAAVLVIGVVQLLRATLRRQESERAAQEAVVAQAQRAAALSQQRFTAAFTHAAIGMAVVAPADKVLQVNLALCELLHRAEAELVGKPFSQVLHPGDAALFERQSQAVAAHGASAFTMEMRCATEAGGDLWVAVHCSRYEDPGGEGHCLIYQLHDITSRHLAETRLQHIAFHDGLTDLANRRCFHERLDVAVERTRVDTDYRFAVLFLDLDRFKVVNDSLGHFAGNELLREVAQRLRDCVRPGDLVARLGGDEFAVLLESVDDADDGLRLAHRLLATLGQPLSINGTEVVPGASIGLTLSDLGYRTVEEVLRDADLAMYEAKAGGRGRVALFDVTMHEKVGEKLALEADLRKAIGEGQLSMHFQPLFDLSPYKLSGFEALARWTHPQRGPIGPDVFIALAEESGHIEALTDWVIDHAMGQMAQWQRTLPAARGLTMHVNISGRDLARSDLVEAVRAVLQRHGVAPGGLTLEITETKLMGRLDIALETMGQLRQSGVRFSIDDFGTGYSSLSYLSALPIDSLKIDRSFVIGMMEKAQNVEIVRAVITLGQTLGRKVIAEGIETAEQLALLRRLGAHVGQGYLLSRPLRAEQVQEMLAVVSPAQEPVVTV